MEYELTSEILRYALFGATFIGTSIGLLSSLVYTFEKFGISEEENSKSLDSFLE